MRTCSLLRRQIRARPWQGLFGRDVTNNSVTRTRTLNGEQAVDGRGAGADTWVDTDTDADDSDSRLWEVDRDAD